MIPMCDGVFGNSYRAISHGCVRVKEWDKLANYLVRMTAIDRDLKFRQIQLKLISPGVKSICSADFINCHFIYDILPVKGKMAKSYFMKIFMMRTGI